MDSISQNFGFDSVCEDKKVKCFDICLTDLSFEKVTVNLSCLSDDQYAIEIYGE